MGRKKLLIQAVLACSVRKQTVVCPSVHLLLERDLSEEETITALDMHLAVPLTS